jgi:hypothetical protein
MARQDTSLESVGAEFLVLGHLLIERIPAYKACTNMPGYDLIALSPEQHRSARIQVKNRWSTKSYSFIIRGFDCDFILVAKLNRGRKDGRGLVVAPEFYVLPVGVVQEASRDKGWGKVRFGHILPTMESYKGRWELIREFLWRPADGVSEAEKGSRNRRKQK